MKQLLCSLAYVYYTNIGCEGVCHWQEIVQWKELKLKKEQKNGRKRKAVRVEM